MSVRFRRRAASSSSSVSRNCLCRSSCAPSNRAARSTPQTLRLQQADRRDRTSTVAIAARIRHRLADGRGRAVRFRLVVGAGQFAVHGRAAD
jgi:hypothetical protein